MNNLSVLIAHVQHISKLDFRLSLERNGLHCIVGRNGAGKTTLVRALRNLSNADTFVKTAGPRIFRDQSMIRYTVDDAEYVFSYDPTLRTLNSREAIPQEVRGAISAELPMPFGSRFNYAKSASEADSAFRISIAMQDLTRPAELINFLQAIYETRKYERLIEVSVRNRSYYAIEQDDGKYIREDYLSSGEFFLINLYRTIKSNSRLIVIDEIDLSLDAAAQAKLVDWLRGFCEEYRCSILFTTHSLAIMRTLKASELAYIDMENGEATISAASYSYTKARLFGFRGWDRYILTEDVVLEGLIEHLIAHRCHRRFLSHKTIYVGGGNQVADLLKRNEAHEFLAPQANVIAVIDGDQRGEVHAGWDRVYLVPIESVEKELFARFQQDTTFPFTPLRQNILHAKELSKHIQMSNIASIDEIYQYVVQANESAFAELIAVLNDFLNPSE